MINQMELQILDQLQNVLSNPFLDYFFKTITHFADIGIGWILVAIILTIIPKTRRVGIICCISILIGALITNVALKNIVARVRPYEYKDMILLIKEQSDHSFPSGHTTASFAASLVFLKEKLSIGKVRLDYIFLILAILISFSRLYLYVHFPTDVFAGVLVGWVAYKMAYIVFEKIKKTN